ncbi:Cellobiose 2-epimerase [Limihaloglobus sulfuriphilus]|uniref:Cellobiose 2-epimerase n=1 Tax=Limihaloglobus sulfuriphilus TaxID=1851148 RepID=A0A1R7T5T7_9BACT|nr:AGE family epimerase/isomerase [Limihaloglobus sulfuriphilus]AQQ71753.1 Cellobiose 2-epimerase [Limihaloglobus sulfuriphilus]
MNKEYIKTYRDNLVNSVIPFWEKHSPDYQSGGTFTCLDWDGSLFDTKKYIWLQGRSVWMFSRLYNEFDKNDKYLEIAKLGVDFIKKNAIDPKGRYYFSLTREGRPYFYQRKVYGAVFCMLAYLEYGRAAGEERYFQMARDLFWKIKQWVTDASLLDRPVFDGLPKTSSLADVMVLASMAIELQQHEPKDEYLEVINESIKNVWAHYNEDKRVLIENAPLDGSDISDWPEGRFFNPGHSIEVAWFLLHLLRFVDDKKSRDMAFDVLEGSLDFGWDKEYGGIYYFMDLEGRPTIQLESNMKLWWPHTEAIYALNLAYTITGDKKWIDWLRKVHDYSFEHFVDDKFGGWFGYCDRMGNLTHTCKGSAYKGFFHVPRALLMCTQLENGF